jgi:hypothetical protein
MPEHHAVQKRSNAVQRSTKKASARAVHWRDTAGCKEIQGSATWNKKAAHNGALLGHCAMQSDTRHGNGGMKGSAKKKFVQTYQDEI